MIDGSTAYEKSQQVVHLNKVDQWVYFVIESVVGLVSYKVWAKLDQTILTILSHTLFTCTATTSLSSHKGPNPSGRIGLNSTLSTRQGEMLPCFQQVDTW